jgi:glycosyltransferase involved in cell wall biosynthesis
MRVAIIAEVFLPKVDGVVNRILNLIRELQRCQDEVLVVCPQDEGARAGMYQIAEFPSFPFPLYPEYRIGRPDHRLIEILEAYKPDVLHYVNPFAFGFCCHDLLERAGQRFPSVFSFHTLYGEFAKQYLLLKPFSGVFWWLMREYHNRADCNITVSTIIRDELIHRGFQRVRFWPPAVDTQLFKPERRSAAMRNRLASGQTDKQLLLTVSRLAPEKNVGMLAQVLERFPDACIAVVGDGPARQALERRFSGKQATFVGYLKGIDLAEAYASADAFVYASETETMGNVVLEAMASGCAVIAPIAGGIPSLVTDAENGLLYVPGRVEDAVEKTRRVLSDESLRLSLSRRARDRVRGWTWETSVESVRQIYRDTIREFQRERAPLTLGQRLAQAVTASLLLGIESVSAASA